MPRKQKEWPEIRELVVGTVVSVNPYSAIVNLVEYDKEGMIHISEAAGKWIKDIREVVKEGRKLVLMVLRIDKERGNIQLSLKRVRKHDSEERMRKYKREQKAEKMLSLVAKELNYDMDKAYKEIGFELQEIFGEIFKAFQISMTPQGYNLLLRRGIPENYVKIIKSVAEKQMELKEVRLKGFIELRCMESNGVEIIKNALTEAEKKYGIEIRYISAPKYSLSLETKDAKLGERKLKEIEESIINKIKSSGGEGRIL